MNEPLKRLRSSRKSGNERFHDRGEALDFDLQGFWQWSASDLVSNVSRGILAEYIVARALGIASDGVREPWAAYDLETPSGITIEVKSSAYVQAWGQRSLSDIKFGIPRTLAWDADSNRAEAQSRRQAQVYVLALLAHVVKATIDPLDVAQWRFYALPTPLLEARVPNSRTITLKTLAGLGVAPMAYRELREAVERAARG